VSSIRDTSAAAGWRGQVEELGRLATELARAPSRDEVTRIVVAAARDVPGVEAAAFVRAEPAGQAVDGDAATVVVPVPSTRADGALVVRFAAGRAIEPDERSFLAAVGALCGQALERVSLVEEAGSERKRLEALMHQLPVGVAIAEAPSGNIVAVNDRALEIWRTPPPESYPITEFTEYVAYHSDGRRYGLDEWPIARSLATGEVVQDEEVEVKFGDGTRGWVSISARPVLDGDGRVLGAVTTLVDVTESRRRAAESRFIADATDVLSESLDPDETLRQLAYLAVQRIADWCTVYTRAGPRIRMVAAAHTDPRKAELAVQLDRRYPTDPAGSAGIAQVLRTGTPQLWPSITREVIEAAAPDKDFTRILYDDLGLRSALIVPLRARGELLGALTLASAESGRTFDQRDLDFAEEFATHAALAVANARLYAEQLEVAETLQRSLLPLRLPDIAGIEAAATYRAAGSRTMVGGDFYDLWAIEERSFGVAIGDVCGKGASAAALTALARHTVRTASLTLPGHRPAEVLRWVNDAIIKRSGGGRFCTVAHAYARPAGSGFDVSIASGGHPLPFVIRADGTVEEAGQAGTLLGVIASITVHERQIHLEPGDRLVMWTDGISDRRGEGELFGEARLRKLLAASADRSPREIAAIIEDAVVRFSATEPQDDIALIVVRVTG
jgi:serine phosphatase RsbU (regulator of sigma subunit)/PAS domain-containing protein